MKKVLPALIAIVLIIILGAGWFVTYYLDKISYSKEKADLNQYFALENPSDVAIILQDERVDERAKLIEGVCYFDLDTVHTYFNKRFYLDQAEGLLLYTTPTELIKIPIGSAQYYVNESENNAGYTIATANGETLYIAVDFVKQYTNFSYELFEEPYRMQIYTEFVERNTAEIKKDTQVRYQGGVKSDVLTEISKGDKVYVLEEMENWSKVKTQDAFIGYVENKKLTGYGTEDPIPVTDYVEPEYTSVCRDHKINMAWHDVAGVAGNDTFGSLIEHTKGVNVISPTWFYLDSNQGDIVSFASSGYVEKAHSMGMEVWALIDNFTNAEVSTYEVLSKTSNRTNLINQLMAQVDQYQLDGINVDFEGLNVEAGEPFIQFIRELSIPCRMRGTVLSVDNYVPIGNTSFYHREEQGVVADYVVIMGYDEHYKGSEEAGSVASIGYVTTGIENTLEDVPAEKIINGIPFYTRIWETSGAQIDSQAVGMPVAKEYVQNHNISLQWDEKTCQNYGEYQDGDTLYQVWMEDNESIQTKLDVMNVHGIAGVAEWKLGLEDASVWDIIEAYMNQ